MKKAKQLAKNFPENERFDAIEYNQQYTVYRASNSSLETVKNEISWTIDRDTAIWFAYRFAKERKPLKLYQGKIDRADIIAYTNGRNEYEVIQFGDVRDIEKLSIDDEEAEMIVEYVNGEKQLNS